MFGRIHQLLPAVVGFLGVATAWADAGYLPQAGPMPLRFRFPPAPAAAHVAAPVVPARPARIALPTPPMPPSPPETFKPAPAKVVMPVAVTNGPPQESDARDTVTIPGPATAPDVVISPQMLIKYFTPSAHAATNGASGGVVAPLGFTPPAVTPPPAKPAPSTSP